MSYSDALHQKQPVDTYPQPWGSPHTRKAKEERRSKEGENWTVVDQNVLGKRRMSESVMMAEAANSHSQPWKCGLHEQEYRQDPSISDTDSQAEGQLTISRPLSTSCQSLGSLPDNYFPGLTLPPDLPLKNLIHAWWQNGCVLCCAALLDAAPWFWFKWSHDFS